MRTSMGPLKRAWCVHAAFLAFIAIEVPSKAAAYCRMTTGGSTMTEDRCYTQSNPVQGAIPLEWHRPCYAYSIDARGSTSMPLDEIRQVVARAFDTWERVTCSGGARVGFQIEETGQHSLCMTPQFNEGAPNVNTVAFIPDWAARDYDPKAYALTTVWHNLNSGEIFDADMMINESLGPYTQCPEEGCSGDPPAVDLQNVVTHEAGHVFGLGHTAADAEATMFAESPPGETRKRTLEADDILGFCEVYEGGTLSEPCSFSPRGGLDLNCEDTSQCECGAAPGAARAPAKAAWLMGIAIAVSAALRARRRRT